jgi:predicted phosphodiesterase
MKPKSARQQTPRMTIVRAACERFKDLPSKTLARVLYKENRALFPSFDSTYQSVRVARGNHGHQKRSKCANKELHRANGAPGFVWTFPHSCAPSYQPFILDAARTLILSDLHIPFHDGRAIMAAIEFAKPRQPDCILLNGDVCDFFSLSRFDKNPTESSIKKELEGTRQFLGWLRQTFPKARIIYKLGNHDEWLDKYLLRKCPELFGLDALRLENLVTGVFEGSNLCRVDGIDFIDDQQKIKAGHLTIWHGHEIGKGSIAPPVNPARGLFMRTMDCGLMGHLHKGSSHEETSSKGKLIATWSTGCLCGLWPRYARVNKWNHGAAWLELNQQNFSVTPIRILNGEVL